MLQRLYMHAVEYKYNHVPLRIRSHSLFIGVLHGEGYSCHRNKDRNRQGHSYILRNWKETTQTRKETTQGEERENRKEI